MKAIATKHPLDFRNSSKTINMILNDNHPSFISISSLGSLSQSPASSQNSVSSEHNNSLLQFSTFRTDDFANISYYAEENDIYEWEKGDVKYLQLGRVSTRNSNSYSVRKVDFRNSSLKIAKILANIDLQGRTEHIQKQLHGQSVRNFHNNKRRINFRNRGTLIKSILSQQVMNQKVLAS